MRASDPPVRYLVGTPKGRLTRLQQRLLQLPWQPARPGVQVKLLSEDDELYVFAESEARVAKERAMRQRQLKWLWARLKQLAEMGLSREELLMRLGAARSRAPAAWRLVVVKVADKSANFTFHLDRAKFRRARLREGRYLLRTNLPKDDPAKLWDYYIRLVEVEQAFKTLKGDLAIRPVFHQTEAGIEVYCLPGLQPARHVASAVAGVCPGSDTARRAGRLRRDANDQRARAGDRRSRTHVDPIYRARARVTSVARHAEAATPGSTAPQNHHHSGTAANADVVKTSRGAYQDGQWVRSRSNREPAKLG
jgi:hypothetical protein